MATDLDPEIVQIREEAAELWQRRADPSALDQAIARWEKLARAAATAHESLLWLAQAYHLRGDGLAADAAMPSYQKGAAAAELAIAEAPDGPGRLRAEYWRLVNRASAAERGTYLDRVDAHQSLLAVAQDLLNRGSTEDMGGAQRVLATLLASPPEFSLRDLPRAKQLYEGVLAKHAQHLASHLAYAEHYAVAAQDLTLFKEELRFVLEAKATSADDELAQRAAVRLLRSAPYLFE